MKRGKIKSLNDISNKKDSISTIVPKRKNFHTHLIIMTRPLFKTVNHNITQTHLLSFGWLAPFFSVELEEDHILSKIRLNKIELEVGKNSS